MCCFYAKRVKNRTSVGCRLEVSRPHVERFLAGAVLHTGPRPFRMDDRILALPIASLWA
jgi:hypothetical protein